MTSFKELIEAGLNFKATKPGQNIFNSSDISDAPIQKIIDFFSETMGLDRNEVEAKMIADIAESNKHLSKAPIMNKNAIDNAAMSQSYYLLDEIDLDKIDYEKLGVKKSQLLDADMFDDLVSAVIVENADFFPLKNPFDPRSIKPFFFIAPDDIWKMTDESLKRSSQGDFTAFCTPSAKMVFNRKFFEKLALHNLLSEAKSTSKKYVSNGGKFPDWYSYLEFVIVHELMHFSVGDHFYTKSQVEKIQRKHPEISTSMAHKILNYVGDFSNNSVLVNSGFVQLPIGLFSQHINYDRMKTYDEMVEAVIAEFKAMTPEEQEKTSEEMSKGQDDHTDSDEQEPSKGGSEGTPSSQDKPQDKQNNQDQGNKDDSKQDNTNGDKGDNSGDSNPDDGDSNDSGNSSDSGDDSDNGSDSSSDGASDGGKPSDAGEKSDAKNGQSGQGDEQSNKIDQAMKKAQEKMANRNDGDTSKSAADILNRTSEEQDAVDNVTAAKKEAKPATSILDTTEQESFVVDWQKLLKQMIPSESKETEETYSKMARSATSSMITVQQTGTGRVQAGEILTDPTKKSLLFVIDNSGSVYDIVQEFNNQIIKLLDKYKNQLENFFVMKFSDSFDLYKVDVKNGTFQEIDPSTLDKLFDKSGKKLNPKMKLTGPTKRTKTDLFKKTFAGATRWKQATHFIVEAFHKAEANIVLFTDDDFVSSDSQEFAKFIKLANKKRGQVALMITDKRSFNNMTKKFGKNKFMSFLKE